MRSVQYPRCNAAQNIPDGQPSFECWQCKLVSNAQGAGYAEGRRMPTPPEDIRKWLNRNKKQGG
jgi:hypothetical protein